MSKSTWMRLLISDDDPIKSRTQVNVSDRARQVEAVQRAIVLVRVAETDNHRFDG